LVSGLAIPIRTICVLTFTCEVHRCGGVVLVRNCVAMLHRCCSHKHEQHRLPRFHLEHGSRRQNTRPAHSQPPWEQHLRLTHDVFGCRRGCLWLFRGRDFAAACGASRVLGAHRHCTPQCRAVAGRGAATPALVYWTHPCRDEPSSARTTRRYFSLPSARCLGGPCGTPARGFACRRLWGRSSIAELGGLGEVLRWRLFWSLGIRSARTACLRGGERSRVDEGIINPATVHDAA